METNGNIHQLYINSKTQLLSCFTTQKNMLKKSKELEKILESVAWALHNNREQQNNATYILLYVSDYVWREKSSRKYERCPLH